LRTNTVHQDKVLVFVTDINTADGIHTRLQNENIQCIRHNPDDDSWRIFNTSISSAVLVCDERAEEGLNIQGDKKKIFHFDLPLNANRIEQRIGRVDRYGEESPVICYASLCHDDKLELEWFKFLRSGLHIFKKSVASLQYLIDEKLNDVSFLVGLLEEGVTFLQNLKVEFGGEEGKTQRALDSLEAQDNLEELSDPPEQLFYGARDLDADYEKIERCLMPWLENHLEFSRINMEGKRFQLRYNDGANNTTKASGGKKTRIAHNNYHALLQRDGNVNGFTFDRNYCLKTRKNVPALLRYGNSLIDGLYKHASETPLGSVGGIWRFTPKLEGVDFPQIFLKNTYLVETDIDFIVDHLTDETVGDNPININMIERRCDGLFPPETITTWITYNDDLLPNQTIRAYLECEPDFQTSFDPAGFDIDINGSFNGIFAEIMLDKSIDWKFFCTELLVKGQEQVRNSLTNRFRENEISIITQMDRRLNRYKSILDNKSLNSEMMINNLIMRAISYPKISLISNLMVCITSDPELTRKMITDGANK
jgi:ATP-dependent helicase HepA